MTNLVRGRDIVLNPLTHPTRRAATIVASPSCVHHWQLDSRSHGCCIRCGAERQFPSWGLDAVTLGDVARAKGGDNA